MQEILILVPAAGASRRMRGRDKLLEEVDGVPVLLRQVRRALATGQRVLVTLPMNRPLRARALASVDEPALTLRHLADAAEGMAASIRAAARQAQAMTGTPTSGLMIVPADMPALESHDLKTVMEIFSHDPQRIVRATDENGAPGHPVVFPARLYPRLAGLTGDRGAREILETETPVSVPLPGDRATLDLDTPEDWAAWRRRAAPDQLRKTGQSRPDPDRD